MQGREADTLDRRPLRFVSERDFRVGPLVCPPGTGNPVCLAARLPRTYIEDWYYIDLLTGKQQLSLGWLWQQLPRADHRVPLFKLLINLDYKIFGVDVRPFMYLDVLLAGILSAALIWAAPLASGDVLRRRVPTDRAAEPRSRRGIPLGGGKRLRDHLVLCGIDSDHHDRDQRAIGNAFGDRGRGELGPAAALLWRRGALCSFSRPLVGVFRLSIIEVT